MNDPLVYEDVRLREIREGDLPLLREWRNDWSIRQRTREFRLLTMTDQEAWFAALRGGKTSSNLMFMIETTPLHTPELARGPMQIGVVGLTYVDWKNLTAEVSIYIGEKGFQMAGNGTKAMKALMQYAFLEIPLEYLYAEIFDFNEPSIAFFGRLGFRQEGHLRCRLFRDGTFHGSWFYGITRNEWAEDNLRQP